MKEGLDEGVCVWGDVIQDGDTHIHIMAWVIALAEERGELEWLGWQGLMGRETTALEGGVRGPQRREFRGCYIDHFVMEDNQCMVSPT